jgi:hypothetical protein
MLRRQARVPAPNKSEQPKGLGKDVTTAISKIKTRRNPGESDSTRIADQTAPYDPAAEHRTLRHLPLNMKHLDIYNALFPRAITNHRHEQHPVLVVEHYLHHANIHHHSTNVLL